MKYISLCRAVLYLSLILLVFLLSIAFNTLKDVSLGGTKTIRAVQARILLDDLEYQIRYAINENSKNPLFNYHEIKNIDGQLFRYEQQLTEQKLPNFKTVKQKWEQVKNQQTRNSSEIINEIDILHKEINKKLWDDISKLDAKNQKDILILRPMKLVVGFLLLFMTVIAMLLDFYQTKQKHTQIKQMQEAGNVVGKQKSGNEWLDE